jgi:hypothetical protein
MEGWREQGWDLSSRIDWTKDKNGQGYTSRLVDLLGRDPTADLNTLGAQLEEKFRRAIEAAEGKSTTPAATRQSRKPLWGRAISHEQSRSCTPELSLTA